MKIEGVGTGIPKTVKVIEQSAERGEILVKGATNGIFIGLMILPILIVPFVVAANLGSESSAIFIIVWLLVFSGLIWGVKKIATRKITVVVTPDVISIRDKNYDRKKWGGFRMGNTHTHTHSTKNSTTTEQTGEIDFSYGGVHEQTKFVVHHLIHSEMVNYLNDFVDSIGTTQTPAPSPETGDRKQAF